MSAGDHWNTLTCGDALGTVDRIERLPNFLRTSRGLMLPPGRYQVRDPAPRSSETDDQVGAYRGHLPEQSLDAGIEYDEDAEDLAAADSVMAEIEAGAPTIPWAQVKADLGTDLA